MWTLYRVERRLLGCSMAASFGLAVLGFVIAGLSGSQAVFFDALYSIAGLVTTWVGLLVVGRVGRHSAAYPFGQYGFEPLYNVVQGLVLAAVCAIAAWQGVVALLSGGRDVELGLALVYSLVAMVLAVWLGRLLARASRRINSPVIQLEAVAFRLDAWMSGTVAVGLLGGVALKAAGYESLAGYVDPLLVLIIMLLVVWTPLRLVYDNLQELLSRAPEHAVVEAVQHRVATAVGYGPWRLSDTRVTKYGRTLFVTVSVTVPRSVDAVSVSGLAELRRRIHRGVRAYWPGAEVEIDLGVS
ncbi:cation diffusion facilitator family transporter [Aquisalimonas sp.]|uniref:cation diffusion facilitator family transporter n=1 Tax=unclassified Aquisalimonas TaxID=2644645 RepID=UPI0025C5EC84|nr:cation diffusion facilitator family transporter [Aquisalimonas sp.]